MRLAIALAIAATLAAIGVAEAQLSPNLVIGSRPGVAIPATTPIPSGQTGIVQFASVTPSTTGAAATGTFNFPPAIGDELVAVMGSNGAQTLAAPSSPAWSTICGSAGGSVNNSGIGVWYRTATSADVATYSYTFTPSGTSTNGYNPLILIELTNVSGTVACSANSNGSGVTSITLPSLTPSVANSAALAFISSFKGTAGNNSVTTPTNFSLVTSAKPVNQFVSAFVYYAPPLSSLSPTSTQAESTAYGSALVIVNE